MVIFTNHDSAERYARGAEWLLFFGLKKANLIPPLFIFCSRPGFEGVIKCLQAPSGTSRVNLSWTKAEAEAESSYIMTPLELVIFGMDLGFWSTAYIAST